MHAIGDKNSTAMNVFIFCPHVETANVYHPTEKEILHVHIYLKCSYFCLYMDIINLQHFKIFLKF